MAAFLENLSSVLEQQFNIGENKLHTLDVVKDGHTVSYGRLGKFANKFDKSAERSYTEEGMFRTDLFNPRNKQLEIWMQEPDLTVLVKKRAFSSLVENYRTDLMSEDERLFLRATKVLFQNKCKQIAAYEKLTKIEAIATEIGEVDYHLLPILFSATDALDTAFSAFGSSAISKFKSVVDRIRTVVNLSNANLYTTWTTNVLNSFKTDFAEGTGVIEFTTVANMNTTTGIAFGAGKFDLSFADPYELMRITHNDIEQAIADATNASLGSSFLQLSNNILNDTLQSDKELLNKIRSRRGANPINFTLNPDTFLGKRVRAIIDNSGIEIKFDGNVFNVDIDPAYLLDEALPDNSSLFGAGSITEQDSLNKNEAKLFKQIIKSLYNSLQINKNSKTIAKKHNAKTNAIRKKLRLHYGNKLIIQPMDSVHIFIGSKTRVDNKILGGLQDSFTALRGIQTANKALMNLQDFFNVDKGAGVEKSIFVGKDFPNWLWLIMRNKFTKDQSGTQVFAGLVETSSVSYSNGSFTVSVSGNDNSSYFGFGVVNFKPSSDIWNGALYDPITPFDIQFDRATGFQKDDVPQLLQENQNLFKSAFVKYKTGVYVGKKPNLNNFVQDTERIQNTSTRRVFYDPDGMVYKWKEGIGTLVMFGNNYSDYNSTNVGVPPITNDPFAGQDIMNVLSLLITGEPYNFATFYKAASQFDSYGRDPTTNEDPSASYFRNLQTDIKKRNLLYGNFVPFKKLTMDSETYKNIINKQIRAEGFDRELNQLLEKRAELNDKITALGGSGVDANNLKIILDQTEKQINDKMIQVEKELNQIEKPISIIGNDISLDYSPFNDISDKNNLNDINRINRDMRRRQNYLTRRLSWKVRANEDLNYFIVDDTYDKDYDIQAFEKSFRNPDLFRSDYVTVEEKIRHIKDLFDLEVFADTQGHIQVRSPQYNKIPSSVFYRMLRLKQEFDIQVFPQFLEDLYVNQIDNILTRIEVLEDEIRMYGLSLGKKTDAEIEGFLSTSGSYIRVNKSAAKFKFISDENTGFASRVILKELSQEANPDIAAQTFNKGLNALNSVQTQSTINNIFSTSARVNILKNLSSNLATPDNILSDLTIQQRKDILTARFTNKTQQSFDLNQLFPNSGKLVGASFVSQVDLLKITQELAYRISERQRLLKTASKAIDNAKEGLSLITNNKNTANKLLSNTLLNNGEIPQAFESLIEDESYDDYGPGSGQRYVIKNHQIKSLSINEKAPPFTSVEVHGKFADNFDVNLPADLQGFRDSGGNALTSAVAVDYDMWRMYGFRAPQSIPAPYLTDPQNQCAPFAVALLNKARKQVFTGSLTLIGNEFMQPGETVYLENQDLLFYVESVSHRFVYGNTFETTLHVGYGHMPGEYIPTYLDIIGKILYKNRDITNIVHRRQESVNNEEHIGTIVGSNNNSFATSSIMEGLFAEENRRTLNNILQSAESALSVNATNNYQPIIELRIYYAGNSGNFGVPSSNATQLAQAVKSFLIGENNMGELAQVKSPSVWLKNFKDSIKIVRVDGDFVDEFRSPSTHSYSLARSFLSKTSVRDVNNTNQIDNVIYNYVVDCWVYFEPI